jgi:hypothetical protein
MGQDFEDDDEVFDEEELKALGVYEEPKPVSTRAHKKTYKFSEYVKANAFCTSKADMAAYLGIDKRVLLKYYAKEIAASKAIWISKTLVAADMALAEGNATIINKMLGSICGLNDTSKIEHTGKDGGAIELVNKPPPISREEWMRQYQQNFNNPSQPELEIEAGEEFDD